VRFGWKVISVGKHIELEGPSGRIVEIPRMKRYIPIGTLAEIEKLTGIKFIK
jgi:predicted RNA binding protein YcfA (HicA-like mRNA interferase family)